MCFWLYLQFLRIPLQFSDNAVVFFVFLFQHVGISKCILYCVALSTSLASFWGVNKIKGYKMIKGVKRNIGNKRIKDAFTGMWQHFCLSVCGFEICLRARTTFNSWEQRELRAIFKIETMECTWEWRQGSEVKSRPTRMNTVGKNWFHDTIHSINSICIAEHFCNEGDERRVGESHFVREENPRRLIPLDALVTLNSNPNLFWIPVGNY